MQKIVTKYARTVSYIQLVSAIGLGACSIWYGAWYPDAQADMLEKASTATSKQPKPNFWTVSLSGLNLQAPPGYTLGFLVLGIVGGIGTIISAIRLEELLGKEEAFKREEEDHAETQRYYYESLRQHLTDLFCAKIPGFDDSCRASVYRHDRDAGVFRMVFRYSPMTKFLQKGRVTLPDREGFLGATYLNGDDFYVEALPERTAKRNAYVKAIRKILDSHGAVSMTDVAFGKLNMPSRCYYGYSIRDYNSPNKIAILILESTNPQHFDTAAVRRSLGANSTRIVQYVRHIAHLDSKLNPYGGV